MSNVIKCSVIKADQKYGISLANKINTYVESPQIKKNR